VPCRRRHERSYRHALPSPGVCPPGVPLSELGLVTGPDSRDFPGPQASWPQRALGRSTGPDRGTPIASEPTPAFGAGYGVSASPGGLSQRTTSSRPPARDRLPPRSCIRRKQQSRRRYRLPCQAAARKPARRRAEPLALPARYEQRRDRQCSRCLALAPPRQSSLGLSSTAACTDSTRADTPRLSRPPTIVRPPLQRPGPTEARAPRRARSRRPESCHAQRPAP
jgi:hypothetical protein